MDNQLTHRIYTIKNSEKCYRFKAEALTNHAPHRKGIYELVAFDANMNPLILFIGAAFDKTIHECLEGHLTGQQKPSAEALVAQYGNLYFDFIDEWNAKTEADAKDVYWWLVNKNKPVLNPDNDTVQSSNRPGEMTVIEE